MEKESIGKLIVKYSLPAIASSLVNSIYNIVDQIFVGNSIGELGNAATNVAFPIVLVVAALAMTYGIGCASSGPSIYGKESSKNMEYNGSQSGKMSDPSVRKSPSCGFLPQWRAQVCDAAPYGRVY